MLSVILKIEIKYFNFNKQWVLFKIGEEVKVDSRTNIATKNNETFDLFADEYAVIN